MIVEAKKRRLREVEEMCRREEMVVVEKKERRMRRTRKLELEGKRKKESNKQSGIRK